LQFLTGLDEFTGTYHKYLIVPLEREQFQNVKESCEKGIPVTSGSAVIRKGHPFISIDFGASLYATAIPLDDVFGSGERLGDKLIVGDILTIVLTDQPQDKVIISSKHRFHLNVPMEDILVLPLRYTEEMNEIYSFFKTFQHPDSSLTEARKKV
jgi:hypothetical protein